MQYRVFAIPATGSEDLEEELNRFLRSHCVVTVQKSIERATYKNHGASDCKYEKHTRMNPMNRMCRFPA